MAVETTDRILIVLVGLLVSCVMTLGSIHCDRIGSRSIYWLFPPRGVRTLNLEYGLRRNHGQP